jgi:hypothetical protein
MPENTSYKTIKIEPPKSKLTHDSKDSSKKSPSKKSPYVMTCIKFNGVLWDHSATIVGDFTEKNYCSVHPIPEKEPTYVGDPDDLSSRILIIMLNVKRIFYTKMHFGESDELNKNPHETVQIPLTEEQYKQAITLIQTEKLKAEQQKVMYSVIPTDTTYSCAGHQHRLLECIAQGNERRHLSFVSKIWPTKTFETAKEIAADRLPDSVRPAPKVSEDGFFSIKRMAQYFSEGQEYKKERYGFNP